jgi:hypothetical protein
MRLLISLIAVFVLAAPVGHSQDGLPDFELPDCTMFDQATTRYFAALTLVAEFYIQKERWPVSVEELKSENLEGISREQVYAFVSSFTHFRVGKALEGVAVTYQYTDEIGIAEAGAVLDPAATVEEIVNNAKEICC